MKRLIGARLIEFKDKYFVVEKDGIKYHIAIEEEEGDCCGFNEIKTTLFLEEENAPVITNVDYITDEEGDGERCILTLFGESKPIADIDTYSSSESGWGYGATVRLVCDALSINVVLSSW